jgi:hypothetical protein
MGASAFSRQATRDPNLVREIRQGKRKFTLEMAMRISRFLDERGNGDTDHLILA